MNLEGKVKTLQDLSAQMNQKEETMSQLQLQFNDLEKEKVTSISYCFIVNFSYIYLCITQWVRKFKKVQVKKSISRKIFFEQIPFFATSKMAKNQFLN